MKFKMTFRMEAELEAPDEHEARGKLRDQMFGDRSLYYWQDMWDRGGRPSSETVDAIPIEEPTSSGETFAEMFEDALRPAKEKP